MIILIWLHSASILGKAFTSVLLNTYCNVRTVPIVEELQDVIDLDHISVIIAKTCSDSNVQTEYIGLD